MKSLHSIFSKLLLSFIILTIPPLIFFGWVTYTNTYKILNKRVEEDTQALVEQKMRMLSVYFEDLNKIKLSLSSNLTVTDFLKNRNEDNHFSYFLPLDSLFRNYQAIRAEPVGITLMNEKGFIYYYGYSLNYDFKNFEQFSWMPRFSELTQAPFITSLHNRNYTNDQKEDTVFSYVQQIWSSDLKAKGVLIIDFKTDVLQVVFEETSFLKSKSKSGLFVVDREGNLIHQSKPNFSNQEISQILSSGNKELKVNGEDYLIDRQVDQITGWTTIAYFHKSQLYSPIYSIKNLTVFLLIFIALISLFSSYFISRRISDPIKTLLSSMQIVSKGHFEEKVVVNRKDELGQLATGFNQMIEKLNELMNLVYKQQKEKRVAEIAALQAQINPHFLYNTLESINSIARKKKEQEISKMIILLGRLLRRNIGTIEEFIPLSKELEYVRDYLEIHQLKNQDSFEYSIDVHEDDSSLPIIKWILQPIVENAIIHGLSHTDPIRTIQVICFSYGDDLFIQVKDNGVGIPVEKLNEIQAKLNNLTLTPSEYGKNIGLFNVHTRIQLYFGAEYGLKLKSKRNKGTTVTIKLPRGATDENK